jgi:hypothetical protein
MDDYKLLLVICVGVSVFWTYIYSGMCVTDFDQVIYAVYPVGFMFVAFFVKRFRLIEKYKYKERDTNK